MQRRLSAKQSEAARQEHQQRKARSQARKQKRQRATKIIAGSACSVLLVLGLAWVVYMVTPGPYDSFAQCLTENGVVMQGEDWCEYTNAQKAMFGKSFKFIDYELNPQLETRPTWIIKGDRYATVQSFERLSALTGCAI